MKRSSIVMGSSLLAIACAVACSDDAPAGDPTATSVGGITLDGGGGQSPLDGAAGRDAQAVDGSTKPDLGPGPKPSQQCVLKADGDGFIKLTSPASDYWVRLPSGYDAANPQPYPLIVGAHGCGDSGYNFATWGMAPYDIRQGKQGYIAVSLGGRDGNCWDVAKDETIMLKAIEHVRSCIYADQRKVFVSGYSSGGMLAYYTGLRHSADYAGIIILKSGIGDRSLVTQATTKLKIAHLAGKDDQDFPSSGYNADWAALRAAGFPLQTSEDNTPHDGSSDEWTRFLLPFVTQWSK